MSNISITAEELLRRYGTGERNFSGATVEGDLSYADLSGIDLSHAGLSDCYMAHVNLSGANLRNASLIEVCLDVANLAGADLRGCRLGRTSFSGADLTDADLRDVECHNTNFTGANLTRANLRGVDLDAALEGANLTGADLEGAYLGKTSFGNTIMPDGRSLNRLSSNVYRMGIIIAEADGGVYYAQCPDLENCEVTASSIEEARARITDLIEQQLLYVLPSSQQRVFLNRRILAEVIEIPTDVE